MSKFVKLNYRHVTRSQKYQTLIVKRIIESIREKIILSVITIEHINVVQDRRRIDNRECTKE